jgi:dienelactone hydrolase
MECNIACVQKVVSKVLFNHVALIATADNKVVDAERAIYFENMPENRHAADLDQWLGANHGFFRETSTSAASKNNGFHERTKRKSALL